VLEPSENYAGHWGFSSSSSSSRIMFAACCKMLQMLEDIFQTTNRSMVQPEGTMPGKGVV
jgi:hypothetical protein